MQLPTNTLLQGGKYRIERVLGQGGFGITYLATQVALGRKVAIKEFFMKEYCERNGSTSHVSLGTSGSRETVERFRTKFIKEAQTIAGLNHPHIIRIHDIFEENGTAYYVMEYWDNGSLADYVKDRGKLSEEEALHYIRQVADALGYIHERKMNHLDVKPANILLDEKKNAVLIDFGLSKRYDEEGNQTSTTPVGISHGYAPLEQYKKGGVGTFSPATDIYSLGATLYKLVTGKTPPEANDIVNDGLPTLPTSVSPATVAAIEKAMQPRKLDRPTNIGVFMDALNGLSSATSSLRSELKSKPRQTLDEETEILHPSYVKTEEKTEKKVEVPKPQLDPRQEAKHIVGNVNKRTIENLKTIPKALFYINCLLSGFACLYCGIEAIRLFYGLESNGFVAFGSILFLCSIVGLSLYSNYKKNGIALIFLGESLGGICLSLEYSGEELVMSILVFLLLPIALALFTPWKEFN